MAEALEGLDAWELTQVKAYVNTTGEDVWDVIENRSFEDAIYVNIERSFNEQRALAEAVIEELYCGIENLPQNVLEFHFDWEHLGGNPMGLHLITEDMDAEDVERLEAMSNKKNLLSGTLIVLETFQN